MKELIKKIASEYNCSEMNFTKQGKLYKKSREEFQDKVDWFNISIGQKLSEDFIREFQNKVNWKNISRYQDLSEDFIREFQDKLNWYDISKYKKLSEDFIREFEDKVDWYDIFRCQKLSEDFIKEFKDKGWWSAISFYQKLSEEFMEEVGLPEPNPETNWLYKSVEDKLKYIKENTNYEIVDNETTIIAYKSVKEDGHSVFNFQYKYELGGTYECHCDMNINNENSFGLSSWTIEKAKNYYSEGKIFKVKIPIKSIGAIVHNNKKIRSNKLEILELVDV